MTSREARSRSIDVRPSIEQRHDDDDVGQRRRQDAREQRERHDGAVAGTAARSSGGRGEQREPEHAGVERRAIPTAACGASARSNAAEHADEQRADERAVVATNTTIAAIADHELGRDDVHLSGSAHAPLVRCRAWPGPEEQRARRPGALVRATSEHRAEPRRRRSTRAVNQRSCRGKGCHSLSSSSAGRGTEPGERRQGRGRAR